MSTTITLGHGVGRLFLGVRTVEFACASAGYRRYDRAYIDCLHTCFAALH